MCFLEGQENTQVHQHHDQDQQRVTKCSSGKEKTLAMKIHLSYWQKAIGLKYATTYFTMLSGGIMKPISKLLENLKHVITWNSDTPDTHDVDFSNSCIISATELSEVFNGRELLGKMVKHFCYLDEEDKQGWHRGVVLAMPGKDRFHMYFNDFPNV